MNNNIEKYYKAIKKIYTNATEYKWINIEGTNIGRKDLQLENSMVYRDSYSTEANDSGLIVVISRIEYEEYDIDGEKIINMGYALTYIYLEKKPVKLKTITSKEYSKYLLENYDEFEDNNMPNLKEIYEIAKEKSLDLPEDFFDI